MRLIANDLAMSTFHRYFYEKQGVPSGTLSNGSTDLWWFYEIVQRLQLKRLIKIRMFPTKFKIIVVDDRSSVLRYLEVYF